MAISRVQTVSTTVATGTPSSLTYSSLAVGTGSDRSLISHVLWHDSNGSSPTVSSIVFNTTENFSFGVRAQISFSAQYYTSETWFLDNPSNTTGNVVATLSEAVNNYDPIVLIVSEYTGANNGIGTNTGAATGNSTAPSCTFTTGASDSLIVGAIAQQTSLAVPYTPGSGVTELIDSTVSDISYWCGEKAATAGSDTFNATSSGSFRWAISAIELQAAAGGTGYTQSAAGALTFAGSLVKNTAVSRAGALTFAGSLVKNTAVSLAGALTFAGSLVKNTAVSLAGAWSGSGALAATKTFLQTVTGAITFAGSLVKNTAVSLAGAITFAGSLVKNTAVSLAGAIMFAGSLVKSTAKTITGAISYIGSLIADYSAGSGTTAARPLTLAARSNILTLAETRTATLTLHGRSVFLTLED